MQITTTTTHRHQLAHFFVGTQIGLDFSNYWCSNGHNTKRTQIKPLMYASMAKLD